MSIAVSLEDPSAIPEYHTWTSRKHCIASLGW
jgi:hypothetical protein